MKVLSIVNITNVDDINSDSGYIFNYLLAKQFIENGFEFDVVLPNELETAPEFSNCSIYHMDLGTTKYEMRYSFDWKSLKAIILDSKPDYIFLNICEMTAAVRALLITCQIENIKIITYCHYPALHINDENDVIYDATLDDYGLGRNIMNHIVEAVNYADYFLIQSEFAKDMIVRFANKCRTVLSKEIHVVPPPFDPLMFKTVSVKENLRKNKIIYNHRLYETYGTNELLELIKETPEWDYLITNPMVNRSKERFFSSSYPERISAVLRDIENVTMVDGSESRESYKNYISEGRLALAAYRKACVWSMAAMDCIGMGVPVIAPDFAAYREFIPSEYRYNSFSEQKELISKILNDDEFYKEARSKQQKEIEKYSPDMIFKSILSLIN